MAGLSVLRLLNEPTAAALAYGLNHHAEGLYLVYDFGGGTFDLTLLRIENNVFQVLGTTGDLHLGGNFLDEKIVEALGGQPSSLQHRLYARKLKEFYTNQGNRATYEQFQECITPPRNAAKNAPSRPLDYTKFDSLSQQIVKPTLVLIQKLLADVDIKKEEIKGIIFVGGSTRLRQVAEQIANLFGEEKILNELHPEEAVALGAALHAENLQARTRTERPLLLDILPSSLGMETLAGCVENIIPQYTPTPVHTSMVFSTAFNNQTEILIHIVQGESLYVEKCQSLGRFVLSGIPPMPKEKAVIKVTFFVDDDGILSVQAVEETSGIQKKMTLETHLY
jgi:molecular chaperone HscA